MASGDIIRPILSSLIDAEPIMDSIPETRLPGSSPDEVFPVLTAEQQARVLTHGRIRKVASGKILVELNQQPTKVFVVVEGKLEALPVSGNREAKHQPVRLITTCCLSCRLMIERTFFQNRHLCLLTGYTFFERSFAPLQHEATERGSGTLNIITGPAIFADTFIPNSCASRRTSTCAPDEYRGPIETARVFCSKCWTECRRRLVRKRSA